MSLGAPLKHFTSCVSGKKPSTKRGVKGRQCGRRSSFARRSSVSRRRSLPCSSQMVPDSWLRLYQEELKRERKQQQAKLAKKNAQRTVRRTQFRSHHCLPRQTKSPRKPASVKDDSFFGAFQGLSLDELLVSSRSSAAAGDQCKVMSHLTARQSNGPQETERTDSSQRKGRGSHLNPGRGDKANIFVCLCFFQLILIVHDGCLALNSVATCENGIC